MSTVPGSIHNSPQRKTSSCSARVISRRPKCPTISKIRSKAPLKIHDVSDHPQALGAKPDFSALIPYRKLERQAMVAFLPGSETPCR